MHNMLSIRYLRKAYGEKIAVDRISFEVGRNEIVGLLGPNGAGKTTTISMVLGVLQPDAGSIHIEGADLALRFPSFRNRSGMFASYALRSGHRGFREELDTVEGIEYGDCYRTDGNLGDPLPLNPILDIVHY